MTGPEIERVVELMGARISEDDLQPEHEECSALCDKAYAAAGVDVDDVEAFSFRYRHGEWVMVLRMKPETRPVVVEIEVPAL